MDFFCRQILIKDPLIVQLQRRIFGKGSALILSDSYPKFLLEIIFLSCAVLWCSCLTLLQSIFKSLWYVLLLVCFLLICSKHVQKRAYFS